MAFHAQFAKIRTLAQLTNQPHLLGTIRFVQTVAHAVGYTQL